MGNWVRERRERLKAFLCGNGSGRGADGFVECFMERGYSGGSLIELEVEVRGRGGRSE